MALKRSFIMMPILLMPVVAIANSLRILHIERCGDLLDLSKRLYCIQTPDEVTRDVQIKFQGRDFRYKKLDAKPHTLQVDLSSPKLTSGPLWLQKGDKKSNAIWVSLQNSHVVAAGKDGVVKNDDGINTYLDLVSIIIEEQHDGLKESERLARKYGADIVGMIPPLNTYQLRLPIKTLIERDAYVLRLGNEDVVDAVVIEETAPEDKGEEGDKTDPTKKNKNNDELDANRFYDAVDYYRRRFAEANSIQPYAIKIGVIERNVDFDAPDFASYLGGCAAEKSNLCVYARDAENPDNHGTSVTGVLAAEWGEGGNKGFLRGLNSAAPRIDIIVDRNSDAGITANIAASVNLVEDGVRILNWSWGFHRVGTKNISNKTLDSSVRSGIAMSGYEELIEEFFLWLRQHHPDVMVVNSAGNSAAPTGQDDFRLPSALVTDQLLVIGGHQRSAKSTNVTDPDFVKRRKSSNMDKRVDLTAAACIQGSTTQIGEQSKQHCGTSYAAPLVTATIAAMLSINPELTPEQVRILLRRSSMTIGERSDFESPDAQDLTAPILPSERYQQLDHPDIGRSARLDMYKALELAVESLTRVR
ncbi:peptidase S8 and S53 subtilisin kexin sedolisin [Saccharophagus sp. K07]|jgi:subtilisin family serine protease|uniref:S8/S53 family peptidase n=1 Tax=Saccharophagus sp. K07 TaxID=2283636 RepID=UPI001651D825|nr:S8/S53 family peptidase [Saccharophagus sp. K07]MBC6905104.1 peptidase S8 and S53 subtilisin kexin sedolisin [Saccharophagus sp. K07]